MLTILPVERRASPLGHDAVDAKGDGQDESASQLPRTAKKWTALFLQPRSGETGKPGT